MFVKLEKQKLDRLKRAMESILEKAKEDGKVTEDEQAIINILEDTISNFEQYLEVAMEDGVIDEEEREKLHHLEEEIMSGSYFEAMKDEVITQDEVLLLKTLYHVAYPNADTEWLDSDLVSE